MEINNKKHEALKDDHIDPSSQNFHFLDYQEDSVEPEEPVDLPTDIEVTRKRPSSLCDKF